jgi:phospholipid/cholesterol/gamma-HCH transport system substrate-binding protein
MRRKVAAYRAQVLAISAVVILGVCTLAYIFAHQPNFHLASWLPGTPPSRYVVDAEFSTAQGVIPGEGQPVTVSGVQVGDVAAVSLQRGYAVLKLELERKYAPVYHDATLLLRPRTALEDMTVELDPGTPATGAIADGGTMPVGQSQPNVNFDEILSNLDTDSRTYLRILLAMGGEAFRDRPGASPASGAPSPRAVSDLRATLRDIQPLAHDARAASAQLALRQRTVARVTRNFEQIAVRLGSVDSSLATLITGADQTFQAIGEHDQQVAATLSDLPGTLTQARATLVKTTALGNKLGPALSSLQPFVRSLGPALAASRPFFRATTPVVRDQLRPFARETQPVAHLLRPAAQDLSLGTPSTTSALGVLNKLLNAMFYNPAGSHQGYSFWSAWLAHIFTSVTSTQDAYGAAPRALLLLSCPELDAAYQIELGNPSLGPVLRLLNLPDRFQLCPEDKGLGP